MNPAKWWRDIRKLAGQVGRQEWYHQFLDKDTDIKRLANKINSYFVGLTDHFPPLCQGVPPLSVPDELLISEYKAYKSLSSLQTSKAVGPDNIPNRILKDFALEIAPLVCDIYNQSLREGDIPALLKSSIVTPIPKVSPTALHQSLLAGHLVSRPWFAWVNPTSGSELRLQLPASLILVRATCNVSFNIRCVHLAELEACMFYWVCGRTTLVPMTLCMGISDKIIVKRITIDEATS